jgi:hypothetical protein
MILSKVKVFLSVVFAIACRFSTSSTITILLELVDQLLLANFRVPPQLWGKPQKLRSHPFSLKPFEVIRPLLQKLSISVSIGVNF